MNNCKEPEFTKEMKDKLNSMYRLLNQRFYTKQELMEIYGIGERQIRMMITNISHKVPVIATSGTNAGYKVANSENELAEVEHTWAELSSRVEEINKRIEPLIKFREKYKKF